MKRVFGRVLAWLGLCLYGGGNAAGGDVAYECRRGDFGDFEYSVWDDTVTITKYVGKDTVVVIPSEIDGRGVTSIGDRA